MSAEKDLYAVLGASPSDSVQQLRHRYQQLALQYHPDRLGGSSEADSGVKKFLEADAAWRVLSDQNTRREYDLQRRAQELKQDWPVDSTVCLEDMTWDEDECVYAYGCRCGGGFSCQALSDNGSSHSVVDPAKVTADRGSLMIISHLLSPLIHPPIHICPPHREK
ncbi:DnaJ like subfamily C member 24, partial [Dissostichus eleginoides]